MVRVVEQPSRRARRKMAGCQTYRQAEDAVRSRLLEATGDMSIAGLADTLGLNRESVRRAIRGQTISLEIVLRACVCFHISGEWLLFGIGPKGGAGRDRSHFAGLTASRSEACTQPARGERPAAPETRLDPA